MHMEWARENKFRLEESTTSSVASNCQVQFCDTPCDTRPCKFSREAHQVEFVVNDRFAKKTRIIGFPVLQKYTLVFDSAKKLTITM